MSNLSQRSATILLSRLLGDVAENLIPPSSKDSPKRWAEYHKDFAWIHGVHEEGALSFKQVCEILDLEPAIVRSKILENPKEVAAQLLDIDVDDAMTQSPSVFDVPTCPPAMAGSLITHRLNESA